MNELGALFNRYHQAFSGLTRETARDLDVTNGNIRFRLFGSEERKNTGWKLEHPEGGRKYFVCVSSKPIEIWGDLREVAEGPYEGELVINALSLGHELQHALRVIMASWALRNEDDGLLLSPDKYAEI
jgi:hypothetical protein